MKPSVLVTGGAGFVGSSLVRRLLDRDYSVVVLDNLLRGTRENLPDSDNVHLVEGDIRSDADLDAAMAHNPAYVIHLAAQHFIPYCNEHPGDTIHVNVYGTQKVLNAVRRNDGIEKVVFASTAAVYAPGDTAHAESEASGPIDIYGVSKVQGEELMDFFHQQTDIPALNARLFNVVGPRETNPHLLPDILDQLPTSGPLQLGNLVPKRDYIFADDIADGLISILESDLQSGSVNIGSGKSYTAGDLVAAIGNILGTEIGIDSIPERQRAGDRPNLRANNQKLTELGWSANYDLESSLRATLEYYGKL